MRALVMRQIRRPDRAVYILLLPLGLAVAVGGCGGGALGAPDGAASDAGGDGAPADGDADGAGGDLGNASFTARASVGQVFVTHAGEGRGLELRDSAGKLVQSGSADKRGSLVFREVAAGKGYRVLAALPAPEQRSQPLDVLAVAESLPPPSFYQSQVLKPGYGYIRTRDGTLLSAFVTLPGPAEAGPYPTVVNYSGYAPSRPGNQVVKGEQASLCGSMPVLCDAPNDPTSLLMAVAGYATVSVNIRGTGCSGGAFDYFETLQQLDGYDVIETVAAQPFVLHHKVGMTGLSYPGISQLFVARTKPPSLAAIVPMSVIGDSRTTLVPGGILNSGFALAWIDNVLSKAAAYGQGWELGQVDAGDETCKENQLLHDQRRDNVAQARAGAWKVSALASALSPAEFAHEIEVPVFLSCQWQDEQTGPFFVSLLNRFKNAKDLRILVGNGVHPDGFSPEVLAEAIAFLDLYVAKRKPKLGGFLPLLAPQFSLQVFGVSAGLPPDRWEGVADHAAALAKWQQEPALQLRMEVGSGDGDAQPGEPVSRFWLQFADWPPPTAPLRLYLQPGGGLAATAPSQASAAARFRVDPGAGERGILKKGNGIFHAKPAWDWRPDLAGDVVAFVGAPLAEETLMAGTGSVDLWVRPSASAADTVGQTDADLEVTLSEVRPDGQEVLVQHGWLRASHRKLDVETSTELFPSPSLRGADEEPLVKGAWTPLRVAIAGFAHVFRKGSKIRLAIDTPGDSRVDWRFELLPAAPGGAPRHVDVAHDADHPSSVLLPRLQGVTLPSAAKSAPPCPSLRGQPCRAFVAIDNSAAP